MNSKVVLQTVRTFLDKMIEKKRGHIVAIASLGGKISFPMGCGYCATKFGVRGFMNSLFDEICAYGHDKFIKTTCVFPSFINTRKELGDILDQSKEVAPRMSPEYVANEVVKGILFDRRDVTLPKGAWLMQITK
jgi:all-trans-retinol dehydrogenase (NAD+)